MRALGALLKARGPLSGFGRPTSSSDAFGGSGGQARAGRPAAKVERELGESAEALEELRLVWERCALSAGLSECLAWRQHQLREAAAEQVRS